MAINFNEDLNTQNIDDDDVQGTESVEQHDEDVKYEETKTSQSRFGRRSGSRDEDYNYNRSRIKEESQSIYDGISSVNVFLSGPLAVSSVGQKMENIAKEMRNIIADAAASGKVNPTNRLGVLAFSGELAGSIWNSLIMTISKVVGGRIDYVSYTVLMFEGEQPLAQKLIKTDNNSYELPFTAFDLYDDYYDNAVRGEVYKAVCGGDESVRLIYSGTSLLPKEYEINDETDARRLVTALSNQAASAIIDETLAVDNVAANIGDMIRRKGYEMMGQITHTNQSQLIGLDKLPIHTDVVISTVATVGSDSDQRPNRRPQEPVVEVGVMADLVQVVDDSPRNRSFGRRGEPQRVFYAGNAVITHVGNKENMVTYATALMALATSIVTASPDVFYEMLRPKVNSVKPPMGDIGAIGYQNPDDEGRVGYIDVRSDQYTREGGRLYYDMLADTIAENIAISIDVPESIIGPLAIKNFNAIADAGEHRRAVLTRLGATLNALTNYVFGEIMPTLDEVLTDNPVLIPMGYFIDANGNKRDLRELNFLAALDYSGRTNKTDTFMMRWNDSMEIPNREVGAAIRLELMREMVNDQLVVKGFARRYTFIGDFIEALAQATLESGLAPTISNLYGTETRSRRLLASQFDRYAVNHDRANDYNARARYKRNTGSRTNYQRRGRFDYY